MKKLTSALAVMSLLTLACQKVNFTPDGVFAANKVSNVLPIIGPPTLPGLESPLRKSGVCGDQQPLVSCLKCEQPAAPLPQPELATKAQKLAKIMAASCPIGNRSYPDNYVSPSAEDIRRRLYACTEELYPETPMSPHQSATIAALLDDGDASLRNRLFAGLWYQPPYSDDFELYFGLTGQEAAGALCLGQPVSGNLITAEYAKVASDITYYEQWKNNRAAQVRWKLAQVQRQQLLSCLNKLGPAPVVPPVASVPTPVCDYKSFEGSFDQTALDEIGADLQQGYKIAMETSNSCQGITAQPPLDAFQGIVKIVGYRCK